MSALLCFYDYTIAKDPFHSNGIARHSVENDLKTQTFSDEFDIESFASELDIFCLLQKIGKMSNQCVDLSMCSVLLWS